MEDVDKDNEQQWHRNVAPQKKIRIIELSDESSDSDDSANEETADEVIILEEPEESAEEELKQFSREWSSPIYVFFKPMPSIEYIKGRCVHVFECAATHCIGKGNGHLVRRYLDTGNAKSTGNLHKHAKICWGEEAVAAADNMKDVRAAHEVLGKMKSFDLSIAAAFR